MWRWIAAAALISHAEMRQGGAKGPRLPGSSRTQRKADPNARRTAQWRIWNSAQPKILNATTRIIREMAARINREIHRRAGRPSSDSRQSLSNTRSESDSVTQSSYERLTTPCYAGARGWSSTDNCQQRCFVHCGAKINGYGILFPVSLFD